MDILVHRREPLNLDRPSDLRPSGRPSSSPRLSIKSARFAASSSASMPLLADQQVGGTPNADFGYHARSTPEITTVAPGLRPMISQVDKRRHRSRQLRRSRASPRRQGAPEPLCLASDGWSP